VMPTIFATSVALHASINHHFPDLESQSFHVNQPDKHCTGSAQLLKTYFHPSGLPVGVILLWVCVFPRRSQNPILAALLLLACCCAPTWPVRQGTVTGTGHGAVGHWEQTAGVGGSAGQAGGSLPATRSGTPAPVETNSGAAGYHVCASPAAAREPGVATPFDRARRYG
jgi:hypothetical protein